jgi:4-hydroxybenzoate polyprenyltransferase
VAFVLFCLAAGAVYLINDVKDLGNDRLHPIKKYRPLAAGEITVQTALLTSLLLGILSLGVALWLSPQFALILVLYFILNLVYSFFLKHEVILDVLLIAIGYVLRVQAGGVVIAVSISDYLWLCTILLALLLALGKRRHELLMIEDAENHRAILKEYSPQLLDQMMGVMTASILVFYALYTREAVGGQKNLLWTVPFVIYGIFRYLYLVHKKEMGGDPAEIILADWRMSLNIILWFVVAVIFVYFVPGNAG